MPNLMVKPSYYNEIFENENGITVYNTSTGVMIKSHGDTSRFVNETLNESCAFLLDDKNETISSLYKDGFLVDDDLDELLEMERIEKSKIFDKYLGLIILPTEQCNFRCVYCYEKYEREVMTLDTQQNVLRFIEEHIDEYEGLDVGWFGGEPLEALDVVISLSESILNICKAHKKMYSAGITTNGYNLTLDVFKTLKRLHVMEYQITIDGLPDQHDKQRTLPDGKGTSTQIMQNLLNIKNNIKSKTFHVNLRTNFTRSMLQTTDVFVDFINENFGGDSRFGVFWQLVGDYGFMRDESLKDEFCSIDEYATLLKKYSFKCNNNIYRHALKPCGSVCYAMKKNAFVIGSDGIIRKCTCDLDNEETQFGVAGVSFDEEKMNRYLDRDIKPSCYPCKKRPICHNRSCKKYTICPPQLMMFKDIIEYFSCNPAYYKVI